MRLDNITVYLIREEFVEYADILKHVPLRVIELEIPETDAYLCVARANETINDKAAFFRSLVPSVLEESNKSILDENLTGRSVSALVLINVVGRWFGIPIGQGRHLLRSEAKEPNFGFYTALNLTDPEKIREVSYQNLAANSRKTKQRMTDKSRLSFFQVDTYTELLHQVEADCNDREIGIRVEGAEGLKLIGSFDANNLGDKLFQLLDKFEDDAYEEMYPFVKRMHFIERKHYPILNEALVDKLRSPERFWDQIYLAPLNVVSSRDFGHYRFAGYRSTRKFDELHLRHYLCDLSQEITVENLNNRVQVIDVNGETVEDWSIFQCLQAELGDKDNNTSYVLCRGCWFVVDPCYQNAVDAKYRVEVEKNVIKMDSCVGFTEAQYNENIAKRSFDSIQNLDKKLGRVGDKDGVEFADLICRNGEEKVLIFNKTYHKRSEDLVYLFGQILASVELMLNSPEFRAKFNEVVWPSFRFENVEQRPEARGMHIVLGVIQDGDESEPHMPFIAKINFLSLWEKLVNMGFRVSVTRIKKVLVRAIPGKPGHGKVKNILVGRDRSQRKVIGPGRRQSN